MCVCVTTLFAESSVVWKHLAFYLFIILRLLFILKKAFYHYYFFIFSLSINEKFAAINGGNLYGECEVFSIYTGRRQDRLVTGQKQLPSESLLSKNCLFFIHVEAPPPPMLRPSLLIIFISI